MHVGIRSAHKVMPVADVAAATAALGLIILVGVAKTPGMPTTGR